MKNHQNEILTNGFTTIDDIYSAEEVMSILKLIENVDTTNESFRKSTDLFAIRQFLKEIPSTIELIFNDKLRNTIENFFGRDYFVVKSIYFDKPPSSNWFVPYHQDLTISVDKKLNLDKFGPWTIKQNQYAVQPPIDILEGIFTIRIHLDMTDENNGSLKVIPKTHLKQIYRPETIDWKIETEVSCKANKGGIMIMKPLLLHSSGRTTNNKKRRVIHLEFSNMQLPNGLNWAEKLDVFHKLSN